MRRDELIAQFAKLGANNPEAWADSQFNEEIPQLHRFVFLRQAWGAVLDPANVHWLDNLKRGGGPVAEAIVRLETAGASALDLAALVRAEQQDLLFSVCFQMDDAGASEPSIDGVTWGLFVTDDKGGPVEPLTGLHESVSDTDPIGENRQ